MPLIRKPEWESFEAQKKGPPPITKVDLSGKVIVVTGANTGLGYDAAKHFAGMNPKKLILACRNEEKGKQALKKMKEETGFQEIELKLLDQASFASVRAFADALDQELDRLDILVENAGVLSQQKAFLTEDGWESCLQVNNLSPELLALLLLPKMIQTAEKFNTIPRLVVVTSTAHFRGETTEFLEKGGSIYEAISKKAQEWMSPMDLWSNRYFLCKILDVYFTRALASHLPPTCPLVVNTLNPGICSSELRRDTPDEFKAHLSDLEKEYGWTGEEGSRVLVFAAVGMQGQEEEMKGQYIDNTDICEVKESIYGEEGQRTQQVLWDDMIRILTQVDPRVGDIVVKYLQ